MIQIKDYLPEKRANIELKRTFMGAKWDLRSWTSKLYEAFKVIKRAF